MSMNITLGEADRVDVSYGGLTIETDQNGSRPAPFDLFLASIGTCAGIYVSRFCRSRGIPTDGIRLTQRTAVDPASRRVERIEIDIALPEGFPPHYREPLVRAAQLCPVKRHLEQPPAIEVRTSQAGGSANRPD